MTRKIKNKGEVLAWSMYDFANQPFSTLVVTFIYGTFFTTVISENEIIGTKQWSYAVSFSAIVVAILSPLMGALADRGGYRKLFLIFFTYATIIFTILLYFVLPGQVWQSLLCFSIANICFEMGGVFCNAYLPDISHSKNIGRISGYGWSLGYVGGLLSLALALFLLVNTENPIFNFGKNELSNYENIRATNLLVAVWFLIFSIPTFVLVKDRKPDTKSLLKNAKYTFKDYRKTAKEIRKYPQIIRFLLARLVYNDGLVTIFAFGGIYAAGALKFNFNEIMFLGIVLNVMAGLGSFLMGFLDDKVGGKKTIEVSLFGLSLAVFFAIIAPDLRGFLQYLLGGNIVPSYINSKNIFWFSAILIGIFSGPNQASSRSLMGRFTPEDKKNEFFGFYAFSGKATAFIGPILFGLLTVFFNSQRVGISVVFLFLLIGFLILRSVEEDKGMEQGGYYNNN
ncbi:MAG: MFS transporter [Flavobacteriales bacterium]|nr:MFS transporter [Flavobacteriales bacterium]|tara:strand:- start:1336 stop:2694 length:1359 start_codon:yes stop_codon:yes gene_type:complete